MLSTIVTILLTSTYPAARAALATGGDRDTLNRDMKLHMIPSPRQAAPNTDSGGLIDPVTQPYCDWSECWHWGFPPHYPAPEVCELVDGPCPIDQSSDNLNWDTDTPGPDAAKCGVKQYRKDCYCNLKTPLYCAWRCNWTIWWQTEDWFSRACPGSRASLPIDFSPLPACAAQCLDDNSFQAGCITQTSNCFCSLGKLFDCHQKCGSEDELVRIAAWLQEVCDLPKAEATSALNVGTFVLQTATPTGTVTEPTQSATGGAEVKLFLPVLSNEGNKLSWDEIFVVLCASITGAVGLGVWIYSCFAKKPRGRAKRTVRARTWNQTDTDKAEKGQAR